jgi:L,D-transpeptidase YcbB
MLWIVGVIVAWHASAIARAETPRNLQWPAAEVSAAIRAAIAARATGSIALTAKDRQQLTALYEGGGFAPLWVEPSGDQTANAREALSLVAHAADDGLDPSDYDTASLQDLSAALARPSRPLADVARFDVLLSASTLRYFEHIHLGRIDPRAIGFRMTAPPHGHDFGAILRSALADHRLAAAAADLMPPLAVYRALRKKLSEYRILAADPVLSVPLSFTAALKPGDVDGRLAGLRRLLTALGDMPTDASVPDEPSTYDGALVEAVRHFQTRHGLEPDGVIGKATQAALRVPLAYRVRQIELALERLRWLPDLGQQRLLAVNIPMFHLWVWDAVAPDEAPLFGMDIIVGRALNRQTPVFVEEMPFIIFRPYWNVPQSIVLGEILPALARDPEYLRRHDMEIVSGASDKARPVALSAESLAQLRRGALRVRQRPGPTNSLGLVKFVFPNDSNVYLHATPAPQLFQQARRDFSHGCVRVADPIALAAWALEGQDSWTRDRIVAAMNAAQPMRVDLARPIQVILFYVTAAVRPEDGTIRFAEDIYGHDAKLDRALR